MHIKIIVRLGVAPWTRSPESVHTFQLCINRYLHTTPNYSTVQALNLTNQSMRVYPATFSFSQKLFVKERDLIQPIYRITEKRKAKAQIQLALLAALENALRMPNGTFEFEVNTLRQRCMTSRYMTGRTFSSTSDSSGLFENLSNYQVIKAKPDRQKRVSQACGDARQVAVNCRF